MAVPPALARAQRSSFLRLFFLVSRTPKQVYGMPRLSNRQRALRETRKVLLQIFLAGRDAAWDEINNIYQDDDASSCSSTSLSSSSDSSISDLSSITSSSSNTSMRSNLSDDSAAADFAIISGIMRRLESRRVLHERRTPRGMERLVDRLRRIQGSSIPGDKSFYRHLVRMEPDAFESIVRLISTHDVFAVSDPRRPGASPAEQAAVAFYWLGRSGNGGGVVDVAFVCGCAEGSVVKYFASVCKALYDLRDQVLCWAGEEEKEDAKAWVGDKSKCIEFSGGYTMVDGSLIPLAFKPGKKAFHREYFDRKGNYSLNIQLVVLPTTLRIVDYVVGYKGTTQDSLAFASSDIVKRPGVYLEEDEFVWTDGGYGLADFTCGPYDHVVAAKSRDFRQYNRSVSNVRVRSEHAFGYLKGRFQCLRGLRLLVRDAEDHHRLTTTIVAALVAHNLALRWDSAQQQRFFLDLSSLSPEASAAWTELQNISPQQEKLQKVAAARRLKAYTAKKALERERRRGQSQHQKDKERRQGGKDLRERLHVALFKAQGWAFEDTTEASRLHDRTEIEYLDWIEKKKERAEKRRDQRRQARRSRNDGD
ncbi:hypothetical protein CF319_g3491 [Tilletia indica]|nr:hypothetical protein CF319_g3491 [Tilletia indica]